jgi:2-oxoisovalerate dehydrogenase E2 component (dihydrolipoyl transacylase)
MGLFSGQDPRQAGAGKTDARGMSRHIFKLPDLGEGTVSAEIVAWRVAVGDVVAEDSPIAEMSTDKAVVEVPSPVSGRVVSLGGKPGDVVSVGAELVVIETDAAAVAAAPSPRLTPPPAAPAPAGRTQNVGASAASADSRPKASPRTRREARESGIDLKAVAGSGPDGRILAVDLASAAQAAAAVTNVLAGSEREEIPVIGVRRLIAQRMTEAKRNSPHFAYVEEVDVTALEALRLELNSALAAGQPTYSFLPMITAALAQVLREFPQCNAHYDGARNMLVRFREVHAGIATQTKDGLKVPVVRNVAARSISDLAAEIRRVTEAARNNTARRDELSGSTITVTSLGKLGGIVSTPILNVPEVAIIGINKAIERVVVRSGGMAIRRMMNLSSSFDHRFVDGYDAAAMIQALKERLEDPAKILQR